MRSSDVKCKKRIRDEERLKYRVFWCFATCGRGVGGWSGCRKALFFCLCDCPREYIYRLPELLSVGRVIKKKRCVLKFFDVKIINVQNVGMMSIIVLKPGSLCAAYV
ncbi:MAG: hypothetical protein HPY74_17465 [Firmicutes bacterium]|nr:hypothetical protein [Bacillota bacterium]